MFWLDVEPCRLVQTGLHVSTLRAMEPRKPDPSLMFAQSFMERLRDAATKAQPDTIAVLALSGTPERGLAITWSSHVDVDETRRLLMAALLDDAAMDILEAHGDRSEGGGR